MPNIKPLMYEYMEIKMGKSEVLNVNERVEKGD